MKIALLAPPWFPIPPLAYGGIELIVDCLARAYDALGHEVVLLASRESTCPVSRPGAFGPARPDDLGGALVELGHVFDAHAVIGEVGGVDIVHDHTHLGALAAAVGGPPTVVTAHGAFDDAARSAYRAIAQRARVVGISFSQALTAPSGVIDRVVHHGIDVDSIPVGRGDGGYLAFLGRMSPTKGVVEAITIARAVGMPLRIAAKARQSAEREYLTDVVGPLLGGGIEYLGELDARGKYELLGGASALVSPVRWLEPFGLIMIEALATGTPVLTTGLGAATEIVEDGRTGFIGVDHDLTAAVAHIGTLDRAECRRVAEERFSSMRMAADYVRMFEELLEGQDGTRTSNVPGLSRISTAS